MGVKSEGQQKLELVLERIRKASEADLDDRAMYRASLEEMLNSLLEQDAFGTEGQCDPRGDQRNGNWTMRDIEGFKAA
jgi:hypothetical protein